MILWVLYHQRCLYTANDLNRTKSKKCTLHTPYLHHTCTVQSSSLKIWSKNTWHNKNIFTYSYTSLYSACVVYVWCMYGAFLGFCTLQIICCVVDSYVLCVASTTILYILFQVVVPYDSLNTAFHLEFSVMCLLRKGCFGSFWHFTGGIT